MAKDFIQADELAAVSSKISALIIDFYNLNGAGHEFHLQELNDYVAARVMCAPGSAYRIMAHLRQKGCLRYKVVSRSNSLYRIEPLEEEPEEELSDLDMQIFMERK